MAFRRFNSASGAEQFVPPHGSDDNTFAVVITLSRGFNETSTTLLSNGSTWACRFVRRIVAAISAATSTQRTELVAPLRTPVIGERMDPETSGNTYTTESPSAETLRVAISIASCSASRTSAGTFADVWLYATIN